MNVGWVGLGKLGLPCAAVLADAGHKVAGYDIDPSVVDRIRLGTSGHVEPGLKELLQRLCGDDATVVTELGIHGSITEVVEHSEVVFVAVQTPHAPAYDGTRPMPDETRDFEYGYLVQAVRDIDAAADALGRDIIVVIVSTVLPGTTDRLLRPLVGRHVRLVYSPQFIAMGTVIDDFTHPEFLLLGSDDRDARLIVSDLFAPVHRAERVHTDTVTAEMVKVVYNTFTSMKIVWANHVGMLCDATGADADKVIDALSLAHERILSPAYMRPGMGDGGACHPRDLIALAHLEQRAGIPTMLFAGIAHLRDAQTQHLAELAIRWAEQSGLGICVLGRAYKANVALTDGSPALLLLHYLEQGRRDVESYAPKGDGHGLPTETRYARVYVVATPHQEFIDHRYPAGSVVIDPWGVIPAQQPGVTLVRPGRH